MIARAALAVTVLAFAASAEAPAQNVAADLEAHAWRTMLQYQDVAMRRRHRHRRAPPRLRYVSPDVAQAEPEPEFVAPDEQNVVIDPPRSGQALTISDRVWPVWCDRVGGVECPKVLRVISMEKPTP